ncbi:MAG: helix-turn-helix domain-containing protein [Acetobacteraceae bacterium]
MSDAERERLDGLLQKGKGPVRQVLKARILLKADASEAGEAWTDSPIAAAPDTSADTVARTRRQLVEERLEAALTHKHSPNSARKRNFDGAAEAKLIVLACPTPPMGRARWTLTLLETAVVELNIVDRASDNTIGRALKKMHSSLTSRNNGSSRQTPTPPS